MIPWDTASNEWGTEPTNNNKKVYVGGLHGKMTSAILASIMKRFGEVAHSKLNVDSCGYPIGTCVLDI